MSRFTITLASILAMACTAKSGILLASPQPLFLQHQIAPQIQGGPGGFLQYSQPQIDASDLAHPAVVRNSVAESQLPSELLNPFYKNPAIAAGLAKESWFTNKEFPVHNREADKISRDEIAKIVNRIESVQ